MPVWRIYERRVRSELALPGPMLADAAADWLDWRCAAPAEPRPFEPGPARLLWASGPDWPWQVELHRQGDWLCLRYPGQADFFIGQGPAVLSFAADIAPPQLVDIFLGPICALLLEREGILCLHAGAVQAGAAAIAFLGGSGLGKSTLTAAFLCRGYPLLTDDILPITPGIRGQQSGVRPDAALLDHHAPGTTHSFLGWPGYPRIKLVEPAARYFRVEPAALRPGADKLQVAVGQGWGRFAGRPLPLGRLYVLERTLAGPAAVVPLGPSDCLIELVRHSFCARLVEKLGWQKARLARLAELASSTPVRRLRVPAGLGGLDAACDAVLGDLEAK